MNLTKITRLVTVLPGTVVCEEPPDNVLVPNQYYKTQVVDRCELRNDHPVRIRIDNSFYYVPDAYLSKGVIKQIKKEYLISDDANNEI